MLKNKLKFITLLFISLVMVFSCSVNLAVEDEQIEEDLTTTTSTMESDIYIISNSVDIDYNVDGNVFIIGGEVTISSEILGDVYVLADSLTIDDAYIYSNLFVCAENISFSGMVAGIYAVSNTLTIEEDGYIHRDLYSVTSILNVLGTVGRDAIITTDNINFVGNDEEESVSGKIYGDLSYSYTDNFVTVDEAYVEGEIEYNKAESAFGETSTLLSTLSTIGSFIILVLVLYLIMIWKTPKFKESTRNILLKRPLAVILYGILSLILIPVIAIILALLGITAIVSVMLIMVYIILLIIAEAVFAISLAEVVANKFNMNNTSEKLGVIILIALIISLLSLIDFISIIFMILGLGVIVANLFPKKNKKNKDIIENKETTDKEESVKEEQEPSKEEDNEKNLEKENKEQTESEKSSDEN